MKPSILAIAASVALGLTAGVALAQEAGLWQRSQRIEKSGAGAEREQCGGSAAGNPGSAGQIPTAPQKQEDLYDNGSSGASTGEAGDDALTKPQTSNPSP